MDDGDTAGVAYPRLRDESAVMANTHNDRPRSLSSQPDSELHTVQDSDDGHHDIHPHSISTGITHHPFVPTGIQLDRYAHDYSLHTDYLARYRSGAVTEGIFSPAQPFGPPHPPPPGHPPENLSVPPTGTLWTDDEKQRLFGSLARRSRWRPDLIALDVKTKSESQVGWYLDALRLISEMERARRPDRLVLEGSIWREGYAPVAREVSAGWVEKEETLALALSYRQSKELARRQSRAEHKELQRDLRPLTSLKVYNEIKGPDSLLTKTLLRKTDYTDRVERANTILQEQEQKDVRKFLTGLTRRRMEHISARFTRTNEDDFPDEPRVLDQDGMISLDFYREIEARWKEDESRLGVLKRAGKDRWTTEEFIEVESLRKQVSARKKEMKEFEARVVRTEEQDNDEREVGDAEEENMVGKETDVELRTQSQGRKRKRRQKKVKKECSSDGMAADEEEGGDAHRSAKKVKLGHGDVIPTPVDEASTHGAAAPEVDTTDIEPRTIQPRDHLFTRNEARTTLKQLRSDLEVKLEVEKQNREDEVKKLDNYGPARLSGREKGDDEGLSSVLDAAVADFKEKKLDIFNLDKMITNPNGHRGSGVAISLSSSVLELLYAHLDVFLRRLVMRVIYVGEGYAADRSGIDDDLRLGVNAQLVYTAMEQIGLGPMISAKRNRFRHLEPFPVRHMLPTLSRNDGREGTKWADDVVPNVAKGVIDPAYGRAIVSSHGQDEEDEDDGLITTEEDEIQDEMYQRLEAIQDELDTLYDVEAEDHLWTRYVSDQPKETSERPWFGDRFDWCTYETEKVHLAHLRKNWLVDDGRREAAKRPRSNQVGQEGEKEREENMDQVHDMGEEDTEMIDLNEDDEDLMMKTSQFQRSSTIARLEKDRSALTKDIRHQVYRDARRRNLPDHRPARTVHNKRKALNKGYDGQAFKSNDMVENTSSENDEENRGDGRDEGESEDEEGSSDDKRMSGNDDHDNDEDDRDDDPNDEHDEDTKHNHDKTDDMPTSATNFLARSSSAHAPRSPLPIQPSQGDGSQGDGREIALITPRGVNSPARSRVQLEADSDPDRTDSE